jgi:hypothetical protein
MAVVRSPARRFGLLDGIDHAWAAAILFINGWFYAVPVSSDPLPFWVVPIQVVHGVFLHEALLLAYLAVYLITRRGYFPVPVRSGWTVAGLIAGLGVLGIFSAAANLRPLKEFAGAGRYFVLAAYFLMALRWMKCYGLTFVLRTFLAGIAAAGAVNLYFTFTMNSRQLGGLPFLLGQSGPGGYLGMGVILSAWLMAERRTRSDVIVSLATLVVGVLAVSISFSKLSMLMAAAGVAAWLFVIGRDFNTPRYRRWYLVILIAIGIGLWIRRDTVAAYGRGVNAFIDYKFRNLDTHSIGTRGRYFLITGEILAANPVFGVGYGGFYYAAIATNAYHGGLSAIEEPERGARGESNPHSSFLYYAAANGIPGLALSLLLFSALMLLLSRPLISQGLTGFVLWSSLVFGYLIFGLTLPTLLNTPILYLPAAFALCFPVARRRRRAWRRISAPPSHS